MFVAFKPATVVVKLLAKVIAWFACVSLIVTDPALTVPLNVAPSELLIVKAPVPLKDEPEITLAVPLFRNKLKVLPVTAPIFNVPPVALVLFVAKVELPAKVKAPKLSVAPFVCTVPLTVTELGLVALPVVAKPPAKVKVPPLPKASVPVFKKLTALVIEVVAPNNERL